MKKIPRNEHPNPQFFRENWENLNGEWEFEFDFNKSALERKRYKAQKLDSTIIVPFCPESELSGVNYKDFIDAACYKKQFKISESDLRGRILLHFGAVDYKASVFINDTLVGMHKGGYTSFSFDITDRVNVGENSLFVYVEDDIKSGKQCSGKQSDKQCSYGCFYTRTTGIWQTVWIEYVPKNYIRDVQFFPNVEKTELAIFGETCGSGKVVIKVYLEGRQVGETTAFSKGVFNANVVLSEKCLWQPGKGGLYDVELCFGDDKVTSYFGLREISIENYKIKINGDSVFQRLVLDQGYYEDGIYTAPSDEALKKDIILSLKAGFNGARLHEKVFEKRFLYYADKLGYLVWVEYPNWGMKEYKQQSVFSDMLCGWIETIARDFNHPSIVGWCPLNETWLYDAPEVPRKMIETVYEITKAMDKTRPCIDASGGYHIKTDIYDVHDYEQDPQTFEERYKFFEENGDFNLTQYEAMEKPFFKETYTYKKGQPVFISEYGGIKWDKEYMECSDQKVSWGYGNAPKTETEFIERYRGLTDVLLKNGYMFGFCYTQLYDVEQERNGLYTYQRESKFDINVFKEINKQIAAIEQE